MNLDDIFQLLADAQSKLSDEVTTLHEDGYHDLARRVSDIRYGVERRSLALADLHDEINRAHQGGEAK